MASSSSSSLSSSTSMMEDIDAPQIDNAFLISLLQDSPVLDQNVDQDDIRLMHVIQSLEAEITPMPITYNYFSDIESSSESDEYNERVVNQMDDQNCLMVDDLDLSWIGMEMVTSLDCGDSDMSLWYMDESHVRDDDFCNVDHYAQGNNSFGVQMDQDCDYSDTSLWLES